MMQEDESGINKEVDDYSCSTDTTRFDSISSAGSEDMHLYLHEASGALDGTRILQEEQRREKQSHFISPSQDLDDIEEVLGQAVSVVESIHDPPETEELPAPGKPQVRPRVRFGVVHIRSYPIILGDNPGGRNGAPVSLGWESTASKKYDIDKFEGARTGHRRQLEELRMTPGHRLDLLKDSHVSTMEMFDAAKKAQSIRTQRFTTYSTLGDSKKQERREATRRNLRNIFTLGIYKRQERQFLKQHVPSLNAACDPMRPVPQ